jgi:hypothetical protein
MSIRIPTALLASFCLLAPACHVLESPAPATAAPGSSPAAAPTAPSAAAAVRARLVELAQRDNRAMDHLRYLTKEIGPRLTGSERYDRAAQWCLEQFQSWGLEARLETWGEMPVRFDRGVSRGREIRPEARELEFLTRAWSRGTQGPLRARARLEPADADELEQHKSEYAGAWILRRPKRPAAEVRKALDAVLDAAPPAGIVSSSGSELLHMGGNHGRSLEEIQKQRQVDLVLRGDQHASIVAGLEQGHEVELEFEVENKLAAGPVPCTNVVADLRGSEFPDEYVIVGAHLDSWDGAEGAQDNGTGVSSTLEAARLVASLGQRPRRTLRFVLFGGEEQGLLGSVGYVKAHADELPRTSAVLIHDGGASPLSGLDVTYAMLDDMQQVFAPLAGLDRLRPVSVEERLGLQNSGDSDHAPFLGENAAPAFFWNQSGAGYNHVHHTQFDTFETVAAADQQHNARVVALVAFGLAELDHPLDRSDMAPLAPRRMGVAGFEGTTVQEVLEDGRASKAGWQKGDVLLSVDTVEVSNREEIVRAINQLGPRKTIRLRRGDEVLETVLDWSDDPGEPERSARAGRREAWFAKHPRRGSALNASPTPGGG